MAYPWSPNSTWVDGSGGGTPVSAARLNNLEAGVKAAAAQGVSSTPPGSPVDGMIWRLPASAGSGVYWFFIYDSSQATNKWVFMGGPPLSGEVVTQETTTSTTYAALATAGPSVVIPRSGDYEITTAMYGRHSVSGGQVFMSYDIGGTGAVDADAVQVDEATAGNGVHVCRFRVKALTAVTLTSKYKLITAGTATFKDRSIKALPIRII